MSTDQATTDQSPPPSLDRALLGKVMLLALGGFVGLLDSTIIGVAVHSLSAAFSATLAQTQWASTAYLLAMAVVIPATGWATQRFGSAATWVASLSVFLVGSLACGLAWSLGSLILFRVVQGLGAGMLFPLMRILVVEIAGRERMGRAMAVIAIPVQMAPILGPVVGGVLIESLSWRWAFLVNVPIVLVAVILSARHLPNRKGQDAPRLDVFGLVTMGLGIAGLLYGLSMLVDGTPPTAVRVWAPLLLSVVSLAWHGIRASRATRTGVVEFDLFRDRAFTASTAITLLNNAALFAVVFLVPLLLQEGDGRGAVDAGLALAPQGAGMLVAVLVVGKMVDLKHNSRVMVLGGLAVVAVTTVPLAFAEPGSAQWLIVAALFVRGIGLAFVVSPTMLTLYHSLSQERVPAATTANAIIQQIGGAVGTAAVALLLQPLTRQQGSELGGFHATFWVVVGVVVLTAVPAVFLPARRKPVVS
ncbi:MULTISPECIES: MDR family MFS transporter [Micromonospora]|uniref:Multidrug efflux MFS transporter n=1 Tax=Micromonospora antibiotica TaxID=2807623 RepID=A0ABS3V2A8_9ACTN|nr:MDR family MFS transporter [Micromonospora antibiotica]MBO4159735.1 multidrug efflux MFS transporter [Micromonospora antibiotica]